MSREKNLHNKHTIASWRRTVNVTNEELDALDIMLNSCYKHDQELFPETSDICRQKQTLGFQPWTNFQQEREKKSSPSNLKCHQIIRGGLKEHPSIHSVRLGIGANHISQTNAGYSRKVDGSFYSV